MSNRAQTTYKFDSPSSIGLDVVPIGALVTQVSPDAVYKCTTLIPSTMSVQNALNAGYLSVVSSPSSGTSSYMQSGNYITQWGSGSFPNGTTTVTLPTPYPNSVLSVSVSISDATTNFFYALKIVPINLTTVNIINPNAATISGFWQTIGK